MFLLIVFTIFASLYAFLWYYFKSKTWCRSQTCLLGKTAIVTGANTGIGYETALDFAKRGARVILACRNEHKARLAKKTIIEETGNENVVVKILDLACFASVRNFAKDINDTEERLDILVNNAGVSGFPAERTVDGLPMIMQINHLSVFLLTNLLIGLLKKSQPSRIINVSSKGAKRVKFDINNLTKCTGMVNDYCCSKICNILFTKQLAKRLRGTKVTTYSVHPGTVDTEIFRHAAGHAKVVIEFLRLNFFRTAEEGAQTTIYTAVAKGIEELSGEHFDDCRRVAPYPTTTEAGLDDKLWEKSMELVQLKPEDLQF